jgi:uncharacterized spore protein YtfJ
MADRDNNYKEVISSLLGGMENIMSSKTVVGTPTTVGDTTIIPLVDVSFGVAAGASANNSKNSNNGMGGMGGKMTPSAILVIHDGNTRLINVKDTDVLTKVLDFLPEVVNKITKPKAGEVTDDQAKDLAFPEEA